MKVLLINSVCGIGSTGKICAGIAKRLEQEGHTVKIAYGRDGTVPEDCQRFAVRIGSDMGVRLHALRSRLTDAHGFGSVLATKRFLKWADEFDPDMVWLHNIHGYYIHIGMLFDWIKSRDNMQVKWTLHDCWAFTGHCAFFSMAGCEKWKTGCDNCPQKGSYPASFADASAKNFCRKAEIFGGVKNMMLITPSKWLADLTRESFLAQYPVEVHYNTIDKSVFKPTQGEFRQKYGLQEKFIILGVANVWDARKGLNDFVKLRRELDDRYVIVLVGVTKKQIQQLPEGIVGITRTQNARELAEVYTAADAFFNPTYEDNYPTVNLEAESCGTRVITYDTGGCRETIALRDSVCIPTGDYLKVKDLLIL